MELKEHFIDMAGVPNVRDLGGYVMKDGRTVRKGLLLRGGFLRKALPEDVAMFRNVYHLSKIFDFRTDHEVAHAPDVPVLGAEYIWIPTLDEKTGFALGGFFSSGKYRGIEELILGEASNPEVQKICEDFYTSIVDNEYSQLQYSTVMQMILAQKSGSIYWHCSQGKDRTGMGAAFILAALGADRTTIIEDFNLSNDFYRYDVLRLEKLLREDHEALVARKAASGESLAPNEEFERKLDVVHTLEGVSVKHFTEALDLIDSKYGGMDRFLREILLVSEQDQEILRNRYLE